MTAPTATPLAEPAAPGIADTFAAMGTRVTVLLPAEHRAAASIARAVMAAWDARFSRFDPGSELSRMNATAGHPAGFVAGEELFLATTVALDAAAATDGIFDPLLGARLVALGYDRTFARLADEPSPGGAERGDAAPWVAGRWREIVIDPATRRTWLPAGTALDLGGIAKGMAVDAALAAVIATGVAWAAVDAGGDLAVHGLPPGASEWPIAVDGMGERVLAIRDGAIATSSVLERRWRTADGAWRHHLIDPRTGLPAASDVALASVSAATCTQAEVAAKVALLLGRTDGAAFLEGHAMSGVLVGTDGSEWWVRA